MPDSSLGDSLRISPSSALLLLLFFHLSLQSAPPLCHQPHRSTRAARIIWRRRTRSTTRVRRLLVAVFAVCAVRGGRVELAAPNPPLTSSVSVVVEAAADGHIATDAHGNALFEIDHAAEAAIRKKCDMWIVPITFLCYLFCFIDVRSRALLSRSPPLRLVGSRSGPTSAMLASPASNATWASRGPITGAMGTTCYLQPFISPT